MRTILPTIRPLLTIIFSSVFLAACGGGGSSAPAPDGFRVDPGDGQVTVSWVADPGVTYWLAYYQSATVSTISNTPHFWAAGSGKGLSTPLVQAGLINGDIYAFSMNARINGGPGGTGTPSVTAVPRPGGATWKAGTSMGSSVMRSVAYGTATDTTIDYIAVGDAAALYKSTDGINWTAITTGPASAAVDFRAAKYALAKFFAAGSAGQIYYSADMATWTRATTTNTTAPLNALATNGATVVAVGDNGTIRYSTDGITWNAPTSVPTSISATKLNGVTYSASGLWIAVGANGTLLTSSDALTWTAQTNITPAITASLNDIAAQYSALTGTYAYVAVGASGTVTKSNDGVTWTSANVGTADLMAVVVPSTNSQFLTVSSAGDVFTGTTSLTSPYGVTWTDPRTTAAIPNTCAAANWLGMVSAQVQYVAVGSSGANCNSH